MIPHDQFGDDSREAYYGITEAPLCQRISDRSVRIRLAILAVLVFGALLSLLWVPGSCR